MPNRQRSTKAKRSRPGVCDVARSSAALEEHSRSACGVENVWVLGVVAQLPHRLPSDVLGDVGGCVEDSCVALGTTRLLCARVFHNARPATRSVRVENVRQEVPVDRRRM